MRNIRGYITVYESSDGGSGSPTQTAFQFVVGNQAVTTTNPLLAQTARLAIKTNSAVDVVYDEQNNNTAWGVRLAFEYHCDTVRLSSCKVEAPSPGVKTLAKGKRGKR